jgi:hypothetical protein
MSARDKASNKIDRGETMADMWDGFKDKTIPRDAPSIQVTEMRNAFYAGGLCLFNWFMVQMDEDREPTDNDMAKVSAMNAELEDYFLKFSRRRDSLELDLRRKR